MTYDHPMNQNPSKQKKIQFLLWAGVVFPLTCSVLLGLSEMGTINDFTSQFFALFA